MMRAIRAEFLKLKGSKVPLWTALAVLAYATVAIAGGFAIKGGGLTDGLARAGGAWSEAVKLGYYEPTWKNLLRQNVQGVAGGLGSMLFGFVAAYVFGRERKEGTDATLLTAPVQRRDFAIAKLIVVFTWVSALTLLSFTVQTLGFAAAGVSGFSWDLIVQSLGQTLSAMLIIMAMMPLVGVVALLGKPGYLKPMLFTILVLSQSNPLVTTEYAYLYPPAMPVLIDGASWMPVVDGRLTSLSWLITGAVFVIGSAALVWKFQQVNDTK